MKEAGFWLEAARSLMARDDEGSEKYTVAVAQSVHSIIRANDGLSLKFLGKHAGRHDEATGLFLRMIRLDVIPPRFADFRDTVIRPAVEMKSKADYKGVYASKADADRWIARAERFLEFVESLVS